MEEWRAAVRLGSKAQAREVEREARLTLGDVVFRDRTAVYAYAGNRSQAAHMQVVLQRAVRDPRAPVAIERWNPGLQGWRDPDVADAERADVGAVEWELRVRTASFRDLRRIQKWLPPELPRLRVGWRSLSVALISEEAAGSLAERLRVEAGAGASVETGPLRGLRRWLFRQRLYGDHALGGGGGEFGGGDGGGGNGGGG